MKFEHVQSPLKELQVVLDTLDRLFPVSALEQPQRARQVYEAAADYLDFDSHHNFVLSWPGHIPRKESSGVDESIQKLLAVAVITGDIAIVRKILEDHTDDFDINYESPLFGRPLQLAAYWNRPSILELLLEHGADILAFQVCKFHPADRYQKNDWGVYYSSHGSTLQVACLAGHVEVVHTLLKTQYALPPEHLHFSLYTACRGGHIPVIQTLLEALPDIDIGCKSNMLLHACRHGHLEVVKMMIGLGVRPNVEVNIHGSLNGTISYTGLKFAAMRGHASIVRLLLEDPDDPDIKRDAGTQFDRIKDPMEFAVRHCHVKCVKALFNFSGCGDYRRACRILTGAGVMPHVPVVRLLLRIGIDLNMINPKDGISLGQEALLDTVEKGNEPVVRLLLEFGVSPNSPKQETHSVLRAKLHDKGDVLKTLLEFGGKDLNVMDSVYAVDCKAGNFPRPRNPAWGLRDGKLPSGWRGRDF